MATGEQQAVYEEFLADGPAGIDVAEVEAAAASGALAHGHAAILRQATRDWRWPTRDDHAAVKARAERLAAEYPDNPLYAAHARRAADDDVDGDG